MLNPSFIPRDQETRFVEFSRIFQVKVMGETVDMKQMFLEIFFCAVQQLNEFLCVYVLITSAWTSF